ncbi:HD domain-containing phosphohydrolase [Desulfovibrio ferrophilus]|uniref:Response regulator n=1 Tax=Desulfovibrio ferrophilus TaxID=241368 RepID=A0A2Z6AZ33_9BACT|nr:HD domain-containing phosphohydrolase [Desulfovibrio ferrophilus]BBD08512.1 response regulator [Desulfovibrio ferrophilus]
MGNKKILFVDDDERILTSFERTLGGDYEVSIATGAEQGIEMLGAKGPFAVVVSDLKMPGMNGMDFLIKVHQQHPQTVRIMLTGYAELETAITAINKGQIFRFLTKPVENETLINVLDSAIQQYSLILAEKELTEKTLRGSVKMLCEILALLRPEVFGRTSRIIPYVRQLAKALNDEDPWLTETAALLSSIGYIAVPDQILARINKNRELSAEEFNLFCGHVDVAKKLIANIPRLEKAAEIIAYQEKRYDGMGYPADQVRENIIPLGARILRVVLDFDKLKGTSVSEGEAYKKLKNMRGVHDPSIISALGRIMGSAAKYHMRDISVEKLEEGMILGEDVFMSNNEKTIKVMSKGEEVSSVAITYLKKYRGNLKIKNSVTIIESL